SARRSAPSAPAGSCRRATSMRSPRPCASFSPTASNSRPHAPAPSARVASSRGMRPPRVISSSTGSSYEAAAIAVRAADRLPARSLRARAPGGHRGGQGAVRGVQPRGSGRGGGALRRLRRCRRDRHGDPGRYARPLRRHRRRRGRVHPNVQPRGGEAPAGVRARDRESLVPELIEDYALLGDLYTAALVGRSGSIDWLPFPHFDSSSCFTALLGGREHGRWLLAPMEAGAATKRRYRDDTLILESEWETPTGRVRLIDFMPPRQTKPDIVRIVEGLDGSVQMRTELIIRFDYGSVLPWVRRLDDQTLVAVGGPDGLVLRTPIDLEPDGMTHTAEFTVRAGDRVPFVLTWFPSQMGEPPDVDAEDALADTEAFWREWMQGCSYEAAYAGAVRTSLVVLKALTYLPTGGIVAAPTTSLPERIGGVRNWDYRYCWLRDATFTLYAMMNAGYIAEAKAWRDWLLRAVAGDPEKAQILYGVGGQRRISEFELDWLPGYAGSRPVRIGNAAHEQFQLDVYGEVMDALHQAR